MAWSASKVFMAFLEDVFENTKTSCSRSTFFSISEKIICLISMRSVAISQTICASFSAT